MQNQYSNQKPEYVLKRANDLINSATGNAIKEKTWALEILHNFIGAKRKLLQWSKVYETLMKRHLELCIDLKNPHFAKDGLHQYRNLCQTMDPNSLEIVIMHMMDITESEAAKARSKADKVALLAAAKVSDLDQEESPESIMLSSMTEAGSKERTDREVVVPWLKFLWESYRAVLELLHRIPKLDKVYHKICEKAFKFCQDYSRNLEFRRLCDMLRTHLSNLQKNAAKATAKVAWEWTSDIVELHLQTRFYQLEVATTLELWNESFRTIEDIHAITVAGRKTPKPKLMAIYYEKLTRIFWVSKNHLFHAFAYFRYYNLTCECRRDLKNDEKSLLASYVLLSALTIPSLKDSEYSLTIMEDEAVTDRNQQMATILDFESNPSRKALLQDIISKGILNDVLPELKSLYELLDTKFHPLTMTKSLVSILQFIKNHASLNVYAIPLQRVIILRVMQQLSKVYSVVKIDYLKSLFVGLVDISFIDAEKIMIDGVIRKELQLTIDHINKVVKFIVAPTLTSIENQITQFSKDLFQIKNVIESKEISNGSVQAIDQVEKIKKDRIQLFEKIKNSSDMLNTQLLARKNIIERRKVDIERAQEEREKVQQIILDREGARRQADEEARLELEKQKREEEKRKKLIEKEDIRRIQKDLEKLGVFKDEATLGALDPVARQALVTEAKNELIKAKEEETRKVQEQAKRLDHITRALRIESTEILKIRHEKQAQADMTAYNQEVERIKNESKSSHNTKLLEKQRLVRMQASRNFFEKSLLSDQKVLYEKRAAQMKEKMIKEYRERKIATARRLYNEEQERIREEEELERERKDKEERARIEKEQYEILRKKRLEQEAIEKAKEAEEARIKEEKRLELEAKRQKTLEDQKRARLERDQSQLQSGESEQQSVSTTTTTIGEKEIVWRAPPASAMSSMNKPDAISAASGGPSKWRGASGSEPSSGSVPSPAAAASGGGVDRWRPSGGGYGGDRDRGASGAGSASAGSSNGSSAAVPPRETGAPSSWRGASGGGSGATSGAMPRSKLDEWGSSGGDRAPQGGGGGSAGVSRSKLDEWGSSGGDRAPQGGGGTAGVSRSKLDDWGRTGPSGSSGAGGPSTGGMRRGFGDNNQGGGGGGGFDRESRGPRDGSTSQPTPEKKPSTSNSRWKE